MVRWVSGCKNGDWKLYNCQTKEIHTNRGTASTSGHAAILSACWSGGYGGYNESEFTVGRLSGVVDAYSLSPAHLKTNSPPVRSTRLKAAVIFVGMIGVHHEAVSKILRDSQAMKSTTVLSQTKQISEPSPFYSALSPPPLKFSSMDRLLLCACRNGDITALHWGVPTNGKKIESVLEPYNYSVQHEVELAVGHPLLRNVIAVGDKGNNLNVIDVFQRRLVFSVTSATFAITSCCFIPSISYSLLACGTDKGDILVYDMNRGEHQIVLRHPAMNGNVISNLHAPNIFVSQMIENAKLQDSSVRYILHLPAIPGCDVSAAEASFKEKEPAVPEITDGFEYRRQSHIGDSSDCPPHSKFPRHENTTTNDSIALQAAVSYHTGLNETSIATLEYDYEREVSNPASVEASNVQLIPVDRCESLKHLSNQLTKPFLLLYDLVRERNANYKAFVNELKARLSSVDWARQNIEFLIDKLESKRKRHRRDLSMEEKAEWLARHKAKSDTIPLSNAGTHVENSFRDVEDVEEFWRTLMGDELICDNLGSSENTFASQVSNCCGNDSLKSTKVTSDTRDENSCGHSHNEKRISLIPAGLLEIERNTNFSCMNKAHLLIDSCKVPSLTYSHNYIQPFNDGTPAQLFACNSNGMLLHCEVSYGCFEASVTKDPDENPIGITRQPHERQMSAYSKRSSSRDANKMKNSSTGRGSSYEVSPIKEGEKRTSSCFSCNPLPTEEYKEVQLDEYKHIDNSGCKYSIREINRGLSMLESRSRLQDMAIHENGEWLVQLWQCGVVSLFSVYEGRAAAQFLMDVTPELELNDQTVCLVSSDPVIRPSTISLPKIPTLREAISTEDMEELIKMGYRLDNV